MFCPRCGDELVPQNGELTCLRGDMALSRHIEKILTERYSRHVPSPDAGTVSSDPGWYCPGCGVPLDADLRCAECQHSLQDLQHHLIELHPHKEVSRTPDTNEDTVRFEIPEPRYTLFNSQREDLPEVIVVNETLLSFQWTQVFQWHLHLRIEVEKVAERGMPTAEESSVLFEVGDRIEQVVMDGRTEKGASNALFLARSTWNGLRELHFRIHDPELTEQALKDLIASGSHRRQWHYQMTDDPDWTEASRIFQLFPTANGLDG
jgi:uncharacterized Zn finger protein (UPF0148 family)